MNTERVRLRDVLFNGVRADFAYLVENGEAAYVQTAPPAGGTERALAVASFLWHDGADYDVEVRGMKHREDGSVEAFSTIARLKAAAPASGGAPAGWTHGEIAVVEEIAGHDRAGEPVETVIRAHKGDVTDLPRELRVFELPPGGAPREVPSQAFAVRAWDGQDPSWTYPSFVKYSSNPTLDWPSVSARVAFLADVPARGRTLYAIAWGNPAAPAPTYATDLRVAGAGEKRVAENARLAVDFHKSGQINAYRMKGGRVAAPAYSNKHGAVHWNPDACTEKRQWIHTTNWDPPPKTHVSADGPVLFRETRSGLLPGCEQVWCSVTYSFHPGVPWVRISTVLEIVEPAALAVLRNGEMVFDAPLFDRFAWMTAEGDARTIRLPIPFKPGHTHNLELPPDLPWIALYHAEKGYGFAAVHLQSHAYHREEGAATTYKPVFYLYSQPWEWGKGLTYFMRGPCYAWAQGDHGPSLPVSAGNVYVEEGVYGVFEAPPGDPLAPVRELDRRVRFPLRVRHGT
jgi:hypothetical protein